MRSINKIRTEKTVITPSKVLRVAISNRSDNEFFVSVTIKVLLNIELSVPIISPHSIVGIRVFYLGGFLSL